MLLVRVSQKIGLVAFLFLVVGCGGSGDGPKKAALSLDADLKKASSALSDGRAAELQNQYDQAKSCYEQARSAAASAKLSASVAEKARVEQLSDEITKQLAELDSKKDRYLADQKKQKEAKERKDQEQVALDEQRKKNPSGLTEEQAEKKAEADKKKKEIENKAKLEAAMRASTDKPVKKTEEGDEGEQGVVVGGGEKDPDGLPKDGPVAVKPVVQGPFKPITEGSPSISVDKLTYKNDCVFAYVQLYNKSDKNRRIGRVSATFKDDGNANLFEDRGAYEFALFSINAPDPTEQANGKCAIVGGSHEVLGGGGSLQIIIIGQGQNAKRAKKVSVDVMYEDDKTDSASGPGPGILEQEAKDVKLPGLK